MELKIQMKNPGSALWCQTCPPTKKTVQSHLTLQDFGDWVQIQTIANHQYFYANDAKMYEICPN
jgi:hypothetical protein